ncbi:hypothetical protein EV426DRAFT_571424 [Tirmania nivea]|nr:hypothetical protein EV426DRAFT_571424 [Tirmania nivea]
MTSLVPNDTNPTYILLPNLHNLKGFSMQESLCNVAKHTRNTDLLGTRDEESGVCNVTSHFILHTVSLNATHSSHINKLYRSNDRTGTAPTAHTTSEPSQEARLGYIVPLFFFKKRHMSATIREWCNRTARRHPRYRHFHNYCLPAVSGQTERACKPNLTNKRKKRTSPQKVKSTDGSYGHAYSVGRGSDLGWDDISSTPAPQDTEQTAPVDLVTAWRALAILLVLNHFGNIITRAIFMA